MDFEQEGRDWPNRPASRFINASGLRWHVQIFGTGPAILLLHGTGASTHSWRHLVPYLAGDYTLIIPDLPGHAFTQAPATAAGFTLPGMANALSELLCALKIEPVLAAGHSAGAAILMRAVLDKGLAPRSLVSINGALFPFAGAAGQFFSPLAKLMVSMPWVSRLMSWRAQDQSAVTKLLRDLGSEPSQEDIDLYARLFRDERHVSATLTMMAGWDLQPLVRDMPKLDVPLTLIAGANDKAVPPSDAARVAKLVPDGCVLTIPGSGHLTHEEEAGKVAPILIASAQESIINPFARAQSSLRN